MRGFTICDIVREHRRRLGRAANHRQAARPHGRPDHGKYARILRTIRSGEAAEKSAARLPELEAAETSSRQNEAAHDRETGMATRLWTKSEEEGIDRKRIDRGAAFVTLLKELVENIRLSGKMLNEKEWRGLNEGMDSLFLWVP